jgi:Sporulation and spore germination
MRRLATTAALLVFMGCGTNTTTKGFQPIDNKAVDAAFLETPTTTTTVAPPRPVPTLPTTTLPPTTLPPTTVPSEDVFLYFITGDGRLKEVRRRRPVPILPLEVTIELGKPEAGLSTLVAASTVQKIDVNKVTTVTLNPAYRQLADAQKVLLTAQLTWTLTRLRGISAVEFSIDGEIIEVPADTGIMTVVGQADYPDRVVK